MNVTLISVDDTKTAYGIRSLSSYLNQYGVETKLILLRSGYKKCNKKLLKEVERIARSSNLIGISCMTAYYSVAVQLKNYLEVLSIPIVLGGIHATMDPENCLKDFPVVCVGEGEEAFFELINSIKNNKPIRHIPNIYSKEDKCIWRNPLRPIIRDMDRLPFPDYDMEHQYIQHDNKILSVDKKKDIEEAFVVMGSRGCPHNCSYCCNSKLHLMYNLTSFDRVRFFSIDYLINHLKFALKKLPHINRFWIEDDTFFYRKMDEIINFNSRYIKEINKPFEMLCSPQTFNEKKLGLLVKAGLIKIIFGIQSGSQRINKDIYNRFYNMGKIAEIANFINKRKKLNVYYDFIGLNPYENTEDILASIKLLKDLPIPFFAYINSLAFYPGTKLYEKAKEDNFDLRGRDHHIDEFIFYRNLLRLRKNKYLHFIFIMMYGYHDKENCGFLKRSYLNILLSAKFLKFPKDFSIIIDILINLYCVIQILYRRALIIRKKLFHLLPINLRIGLKILYKKIRGGNERTTVA